MLKKGLIYFLCICFLLATNGFYAMVAEAKERSLPIGEMVSKGGVKFESRENIWKNVESSHFPIFKGMRIKTEKGVASVSFNKGGIIEVKPNTMFLFSQEDLLILSLRKHRVSNSFRG